MDFLFRQMHVLLNARSRRPAPREKDLLKNDDICSIVIVQNASAIRPVLRSLRFTIENTSLMGLNHGVQGRIKSRSASRWNRQKARTQALNQLEQARLEPEVKRHYYGKTLMNIEFAFRNDSQTDRSRLARVMHRT